jgi:hypothetical protein
MPSESNQSGRSNSGRGRTGRRERDSFLSPDLEMLAEQLAQDSQWLALNYPAAKPSLPLRKPRRFKWVAVAAVAALLLLAIDGWWLWNRPAAPIVGPSNLVVAPPAGSVRPASEVPLNRPALMETRLPGAMFKNLSGAEKEAVLDFLEERAPALPNTSLPL